MKAVVASVLALALLVSGTASVRADAVYHTERLALEATGAAPGGGTVINVHPNGPQIYAHEIYTLTGTLPNTEYVVRLWVHPFDPPTDESPGCTSTGVNFRSTTVETNAAGNGRGDLFIGPDEVPTALRGNQSHGVRWDVTLNGVTVYQTVCTKVTLD